jgi:hypothetical protein
MQNTLTFQLHSPIGSFRSTRKIGGNMQDLVNRLQSAQDLVQQLLVRL